MIREINLLIHSGEWTLLDEKGATALSFTSFIDIDYRNEGQTLSYPIEAGSFANYNKTNSPLNIRVTLGVQGSESDFEHALQQLDEYRNGTVKLSVSTPACLYENMTLESYSYKRSRENGSGMLTVELNLIEVREVETRIGTTEISNPQNPTSSGIVKTGKTQVEDFRGLSTKIKKIKGIINGVSR